jgi:hypothetical protein
LNLAACEFLGRRIEANRPESNIVEWGGRIHFRNLTATFFNRCGGFVSGGFFSSFLANRIRSVWKFPSRLTKHNSPDPQNANSTLN